MVTVGAAGDRHFLCCAFARRARFMFDWLCCLMRYARDRFVQCVRSALSCGSVFLLLDVAGSMSMSLSLTSGLKVGREVEVEGGKQREESTAISPVQFVKDVVFAIQKLQKKRFDVRATGGSGLLCAAAASFEKTIPDRAADFVGGLGYFCSCCKWEKFESAVHSDICIVITMLSMELRNICDRGKIELPLYLYTPYQEALFEFARQIDVKGREDEEIVKVKKSSIDELCDLRRMQYSHSVAKIDGDYVFKFVKCLDVRREDFSDISLRFVKDVMSAILILQKKRFEDQMVKDNEDGTGILHAAAATFELSSPDYIAFTAGIGSICLCRSSSYANCGTYHDHTCLVIAMLAAELRTVHDTTNTGIKLSLYTSYHKALFEYAKQSNMNKKEKKLQERILYVCDLFNMRRVDHDHHYIDKYNVLYGRHLGV